MKPFAIEMKNVSKTVHEDTILHNINLQIPEGELLGIFGNRGSGKSTLLRVISGLFKHSEGEINIFQFNMNENYVHAISVIDGFINAPRFYPNLTGLENLELTFIALGKRNKEILMQIIELFKLSDFIHKKTKHYDLFAKQKLALAQALISKPKILLLDQPTNGLADDEIEEYFQYLQILTRDKGITVLFTSNNMPEIQPICDRIIVLEKGEIVNEFNYKLDDERQYFRYMLQVNAPSLATYIIETHLPLLHGLVREFATYITLVTNKKTVPKIIEFLAKNGIEVYELTKLEQANAFMNSKLFGDDHL